MRLLVTGADGFVGNYLLRELIFRGHDVIAGYFELEPRVACQNTKIDITDSVLLEEVLRKYQPDGVIHLAAQSNVKLSWDNPAITVKVNTEGTIILLETIAKISEEIKVVCVGSSEEYGSSALTGEPLTELDVCYPQNPYAVSKFAAGLLALQIAKKENLNVIYARPFNHFGPGQPRGFIVSDFASQIAQVEQGLMDNVIRVGDLGAKRDFTDVRDVVNAYALLMEKEVEPGIYNICSGSPRSAREILEFLIEGAKVPVHFQVDQERYRSSEVPFFVGSAEKIKKAVSWKINKDFFESLTETLGWWRTKKF